MFWKYNHQSSPHIDTLLNKEDVTLQELMDEEDVLQECKVQNKKLIDFLVRPEVMEELVRLTTVEPTGEIDEKQRYKYPNIACEILTCDVPTLNERLAGDEELLGKLYTFLETESPLNPLLASFFSKTLGVLVARKSEQNWYSYQFTCLQVLEFLKSKENFLTLLLKHLGTSAIMDLLLKLITQIEGAEMKQSILNWLDSQQVIQCLVGLLDPAVECERNCNASQLLCDVIKTSRDNQHTSVEKGEPDPILSRVEDPEVVTQLLDRMFGAEKRESSIVGGVTVLLTLLDCSRPPHEAAGDQVAFLATDQPHDDAAAVADGADHASKVALTTLEAILPRLKDFHGLLVDPPYKPSVRTTAGVLDPPLGNTRLHVAKLLATVIAANHPAINKELASLGTVETLLDLFFKYSWNNFLHSQVEQCLAFALNVDVVDPEGEGDPASNNALLKNIFIQCRLLQRILEAWDDNDSQQSKEGGLRRGYMGHLIKIANCVMTQVEKGSLGGFIQENVPADTVTAWEAFVAGAMAETNKTHAISLGGVHPAHSSSEDDDADYSDIPFPQDIALQQAFADYQMQQIAPQFIENYGFHDEEFLDGDDMLHASVDRLTSMTFNLSEAELDKQAELFKTVCEQKMRGVNDTEDDVWDDQDSSFPTMVNTRTSADWQSALDGEAANSSDEDEREGPEGREEIRMEVDTTDPWAAGETASESMVAGVAVDAANPWATPATGTTTTPAADQGGWADFGSGGFADFDANFDSPSDEKKPAEIAPTEGTTSTIATTNVTDEPAALPVVSPVPADKNANPSSESGQEDQLNDNHRFLGTPVASVPAGAGDQSAAVSEEAAVLDATEPPAVTSATVLSSAPAAVVAAEQMPPLPKSVPAEEPPSAAAVPSPNGPI